MKKVYDTFLFLAIGITLSDCFSTTTTTTTTLSPSPSTTPTGLLYHSKNRLTFSSLCSHPYNSCRGETNPSRRDDSIANTVHVYENAFHPSACELLHGLTIEHNYRTNDGSSVFTRPPHNEHPLTPIEHAIDSALTEIGDTSRLVEYWSRDEYMNIDVHADIDEIMLEDQEIVRCPLMGHVLYLRVKDGLRGPTCVFPREQVGWGLSDDGEEDEEGGGKGNRETKKKELVTVPAVAGRIVRFPGSAMHSVPSPPHRWLLSRKEQRILRKEEETCNDDAVYEDEDDEWSDDYEDYDDEDDDDEEDEPERSVLLFNTWPDDEIPPIGVNGDYATGALPEGIELDDDDDDEEDNTDDDDGDAFMKSREAQLLREWEEDYGKNGERVRCNPVAQWRELSIAATKKSEPQQPNHNKNKNEKLNLPLMGKQSRRLYPSKYVQLLGPGDVIRKALEEPSAPTLVLLDKSGEENQV